MSSYESNAHSATVGSYIAGFALSVIFCFSAFTIVMGNLLTGTSLVVVLISLALAQAFVQMIFFLHLGRGSHWSKVIFLSTAGIIFILVGGSLWIMNHLNYHMTSGQMEEQVLKSEGITK